MESPTTSQTLHADRLLFFGMLLFLFGLLVGLAIPALANPRMGLASHLDQRQAQNTLSTGIAIEDSPLAITHDHAFGQRTDQSERSIDDFTR